MIKIRTKKKILFIITNFSVFYSFFRDDIRNIAKYYDIHFLVYKYGFHNQNFQKKNFDILSKLKKKQIIKKIFWLEEVSYSNFYKNLLFNRELIKIIKKIKTLNIDYFLLPPFFHYWEELFFQIFKKHNIFCYLLNAPGGLDYFNNFRQLKKSLKLNKLFYGFHFKSDNQNFYFINQRPLANNYIILIYQKLNIAFSKLLNHYLIPILLIKKIINTKSIYYRLNFKFYLCKKIINFNNQFKIFLKKFNLKKRTIIFLCSKYNFDKEPQDYNWIYTYSSSKDKQTLSKLFNYLKILKKLKKLNYVYFKGHPTWEHEYIQNFFFTKLRQHGIKFKFIDSIDYIDFSKFYGLISAPSTVLVEAQYHNPNIKIIGIRRNKNITSGLLLNFYSLSQKQIIWEPKIDVLKNYLTKKKINTNIGNNLKDIISQVDEKN